MAKVRIGLSRLTVPERIARARHIIKKMKNNAHFPWPKPTLLALKNAVDALEKLYNESRNNDRVKLKLMAWSNEALLKLITQLAAYVQVESGGDAEIILSSGFDCVGKRVIGSDTAGAVYRFRASRGTINGSLRGDWDAAKDAVNYRVEVATDRNFTVIVKKKYTTTLHKEITGLKQGIYWMRVTAIGREEEGPTCQGLEVTAIGDPNS